MLAGRNTDHACRLFPKRTQCGQLRLDLIETWTDAAEQAFAGFGRRDMARRAREEPQFMPRLKPADGVAQCRLRDPELRRSLGEAPLFRHGEEGEEVVNVFARHS
jgi:hypothetical protein